MRSVELLIATAEHVRKTRPNRSLDLEFLSEVFREVGLNLSPCEIASVTYLTWHGSASDSGVTFREHLVRLKVEGDCELDTALKSQITDYREAQVRLQREREEALASEGQLMRAGAGLLLGTAVVAGAFILMRRNKLALEREAAERQSRRERRRHRRQSRTASEAVQGVGDVVAREQVHDSR